MKKVSILFVLCLAACESVKCKHGGIGIDEQDCKYQDRQWEVCNNFCNPQAWSINESHGGTYRYWCTCNDGRQKEIF